MFCTRLKLLTGLAVIALSALPSAWAHDLRITFPRHSKLTPVQRLNREGVDAVQKHEYEKAEAIFYKAYLYDASDPFTLNNLGYISELEGKLDQAKTFYGLASKQDCNALISLSNTKQLEGKPMTYALTSLKDVPLRVNRMNVQAIVLLSENRNFEADNLLQQALTLEPDNPFTLNNIGVAKEATGDFDGALKYYDQAADSHSMEPIVVTLQRSLRGKPVSEIASDSARELREKMQNISTEQARATMLTFRGVAAINGNDWSAAKQDFLEAYSLDPQSAFSLNNRGYVAEKNGDLETAQFYYSKARTASGADTRVGLATEQQAQGEHLVTVASDSHLKVNGELERYSQAARRQTGPIELIRRGETPAKSGASPQKPATQVSPSPGPQKPE